MKGLLQRISKKTLSVILALALLLSSLTVMMSAFATTDGNPYTVSYRSPAIPMFAGKILNYEDIEVKFSDELTVNGADITWELNESVQDDDNVSARSKYIYAPTTGKTCLTATYGELTQNVWVIVNEQGNYDFKLVDIDFSKLTRDSFVNDSNWMFAKAAAGFNTTSLSKIDWPADSYGSYYPTATRNYFNLYKTNDNYYLLYTADILKDFPDYTFNTTAAAGKQYDVNTLRGFILRANIDFSVDTSQNALSGNVFYAVHRQYGAVSLGSYQGGSFSGLNFRGHDNCTLHSLTGDDWKKFINTGEISNNASSNPAGDNDYVFSMNLSNPRNISITLDGNNIKYVLGDKTILDTTKDVYKISNDSSAANATNEAFDYASAFAAHGYSGTGNAVGFTFVQGELNLYSFSVTANGISEDTMPNLQEPSFYSISYRSPAIPMFSGKVVYLADLQLTFNDGVSANGEDITWKINDDAENSGNLILMSNCIYATDTGKVCLTATYKNHTQNVWVIINSANDFDFNLVNLSDLNSTGYNKADWLYAISTAGANNQGYDPNGDSIAELYASTQISNLTIGANWNTQTKMVVYRSDILKDFADYTVSTILSVKTGEDGTKPYMGIITRAEINPDLFDENGNIVDTATTLPIIKTNTTALFARMRMFGGLNIYGYVPYGSTSTVTNMAIASTLHTLSDSTLLKKSGDPAYVLNVNTLKYGDGTTNSGKDREMTLKLSGNDIFYSLGNKTIFNSTDDTINVMSFTNGYDGASASNFTDATFTEETITKTSYYSTMEDLNTGNGTIGFTWGRGFGLTVKTLKVSLNDISSLADMPKMADASFYTVTDENPVIPMTAGTKLNVGNFFVDVDSSLVAGNEFTWTTSANAAELAVDGNEIKAYKKGAYTLTATDGTTTKTIYAIVKNPDEEEYTVFENDYRSGTTKNEDGTYSARTDYDTWTNVVDINNKVYTAPVTGSLHNVSYNDGWLATFPTAGFRPYISSTLRSFVGEQGIQESSGYNFTTLTLLDNDIIENIANYKITADLIMDKGETYAAGLVGRATYDSVDTVSYGYTIVAGGYNNPLKADTIARISGSNFATPVTDQTVAPTWFTGVRSGANFALHTYTLEFVGDTMTLTSPDMHNPEGNKIVTTGLPVAKGGVGIVTVNRYSTGSKRLAAPSVYSIKVTLTNLSNVERLGAVAMDGVSVDATEKIGGYTETDTYTLGYTLSADGNSYSVTSYTNEDGLNEKITIPAIYEGKPVISTGASLINGNTKIGEVVFETAELAGETVGATVIGERSFFGCRNLEFVTLPETYVSNGYGSFQGCNVLREVHLPSSFNNFNHRIYSGCISLKKITVDSSFISQYMFEGCISLSEIVFKNESVNLFDNAFVGCTSLVEVSLPDKTCLKNTVAPAVNVFKNCTNLKTINLSTVDSVIPDSTFYGCTALNSIVIPDNITTIEANAFYDTGLTEVEIPASVTSIATGAFSGTKNVLKKATILNASCEINDSAFLDTATDTLKPDIVIYGINGSTAETYADAHNDLNDAGIDGVRFEAIDYTLPSNLSLNSKSYMPSTLYGVPAKWTAVTNEYFELYDNGLVVALKKGEAEIPCTITLGGTDYDIAVKVTVDDYDAAAYNHIVASDKASVAATGVTGQYSISFADDLYIKYNTFKINGSANITADEQEINPVPTGKVFVFNVADYGAENLQNIKIKFEETEKDINSGSVYTLGATTRVFDDNSYGVRVTSRIPAIKYSGTNEDGAYGKFADDVVINGKPASPVAVGSLVYPEALLGANELELNDAQISAIANGEDITAVQIGNYNATNIVIGFLSDLTEAYSDYNILLANMPKSMCDVSVCYRNYIIYEADGKIAIKYEDIVTKDYDTVTKKANTPITPLNVAAEAVKPESFENENVVISWGDSITQSTVGNSYPSQLMQNLGGQYLVYNAGDAGETATAILSRANLEEIYLQYDITFSAGSEYSDIFYRGKLPEGANSASSSAYTDCWVVDKNGKNVYYTTNGNQLPIATGRNENSCGANVVINGVNYELIEVYENGLSTYNPWGKTSTFKLKRTGNTSVALTLTAGTQVSYDHSASYKKADVGIVLYGANGYYFDAYHNDDAQKQALIAQFKQMSGAADKMLYIIPYFWSNDITNEFVEAFGEDANKLVHIREYLRDGAFEDYDVTPTEKDLYYINEMNMTPYCFMATQPEDNSYDCHMSQLGYKILADLIYKQGVELGYWK